MRILGIESSCDETAAAVVVNGHIIESSVIYSQVQEHQAYGGVVPELASRSHLLHMLPTIDKALAQASCTFADLDAIAVTSRPGLMGALIMGVSAAKALAFAHNLPLVGVHHIYGHLVSSTLDQPECSFPALALIASGGHTLLYRVDDLYHFEKMGQSIDDAAGEALDKAAKMLGLGFPGGPALEKAAQGGDPQWIAFPRPLANDIRLSFSGLKTSLAVWLQKNPSKFPQHLADIAASFQEAVMDCLVQTIALAQKQTGIDNIIVCGGVAANGRLREKLAQLPGTPKLWITPKAYCTDNAAMIAAAGYYTYKMHGASELTLIPQPNAPLVASAQADATS
jgi:N6-L-threonylcarbamoyladenine synthase